MFTVLDTRRSIFSAPTQVAFESDILVLTKSYPGRLQGTGLDANPAADALVPVNVPGTGHSIDTQGHIWQRTGGITAWRVTLATAIEVDTVGKRVMCYTQSGQSGADHTIMG